MDQNPSEKRSLLGADMETADAVEDFNDIAPEANDKFFRFRCRDDVLERRKGRERNINC